MGEKCKSRAKKGAHYSAPTPHGTPGGLGHRLRRLAIATLSLAALAVVPLAPTRVLAAPAPASRPEDARKAEEQLQAVKAEIERVTREVSAELVERDRLTRELRAAMERFPVEGNDAFMRLRGKLAWPVNGHLVARFGDTRAGGVHWDGVLVATERGAPVKAVCQGRVIYADWLPGLGLLAIVDHGDGYLSLYGHNERLYKAAGEQVAAGDTIAAAGDSGGSPRPELYFEIRKGGKPVDPRPWFRAPDP